MIAVVMLLKSSPIQEKAMNEERRAIKHREITEFRYAVIRKWMHSFKKHGKAGLEPKLRSDAEQCRSLTHHRDRAVNLGARGKTTPCGTTVLA